MFQSFDCELKIRSHRVLRLSYLQADLYAGALFITEAVGQKSDQWLYISIFILLAIAAIFCIAGGLTAVIWTDFVQTVLMIIGAFILMAICKCIILPF